jgi:hypothetical protein
MLTFLRQSWLAIGSMMVSLFAVWLSYIKLRRESRPILHVRGSSGKVEIENIGPVAAVDVTVTLLEPTKRPSGRLVVENMLRAPGGKATISAWDWPKELEAEIRQNQLLSLEDEILRLEGKESPIPTDRVAQYLLCRHGGRLLVRYRIADNPRIHVRLFKVQQSGEGFPHFVRMRPLLGMRFHAVLLQLFWRLHPQYQPPFKFPRG